MAGSFHSISFPSEWESSLVTVDNSNFDIVSIQLVFPASGKGKLIEALRWGDWGVSIQLVFPASGKD